MPTSKTPTPLTLAKRARRAREKAAQDRALSKLTAGNYSVECIRCSIPGPGKTFAKRVKVCNNCWKDMTLVERRNIRGFASQLG